MFLVIKAYIVFVDLRDFVRVGVFGLPEYVPGEYCEGYIKLASNENNYGPSQKVVDALKRISSKTNLYPFRDDDVRGKIAGYAGVKKENIVLGNGSDEIIDFITKAFKGPYAGMRPSFPIYKIAANTMGEKYIEVPYEKDFVFDAGNFLEKTKKANVFFLCSPNNPTGTSISDKDLRMVLESGKIIILDEAYIEFAGKSRAAWTRKYKNLIILRTMAKAFALAGLRIGYAVASKEAAETLMKVKPPFNTSSFAQEAALAALDDIAYMRKSVEKIKKEKERVYNALSKRYKIIRSDGNFIFFDVSPMGAQKFYDKMLEKKIIVRKYGKIKGYKGEYIRVSVGTENENNIFLGALNGL
jgi:histidinol-phosphate aminotransferase